MHHVTYGMRNLHYAMRHAEMSDFWEPLFELMTFAMEQKLREKGNADEAPLLSLQSTSDLLYLLGEKKNSIDQKIVTKLYNLVKKGLQAGDESATNQVIFFK